MNTTPARRCRVLRLALTATIALGAWSAKAEKVQVWAKGVTAESGWENTFQFSNGCWAGCATDMIAWWQKRIAEKYDYSGIKVWDCEELIQQYDTNPYFGNGGDYVWRALEWVFTNTVKKVALPKPGDRQGGYGYYQTADDKNTYPISIRGWLNTYRPSVEAALQAFMDANGNAIACVSSTGHAWTLYGVEYDTETRKFTRVWATDPYPDDTTKRIPTLSTFDVMYSNYQGGDLCYFLRYIYDDYNNSWNPQEIEPAELTLLRIDDELLVDSEGNPSFKLLGGGDGDTPTFNPIRPGDEAKFDSQTQADAFIAAFGKDRPSFVTPPDGLPASLKSRYAGLFEAKIRDIGDGKFAVAVELTAAAKEDAQKQVDDWSSIDLPQMFSNGGGKFATTPGLYYSVLAGETPSELKVKSSTLATDESLELKFPRFSTGGFYRVKATVTAEDVQ